MSYPMTTGWAPVPPAPTSGPAAPQLPPDSALVRSAVDLVRDHGATDILGRCERCGRPAPCPAAVNARNVVSAAGLDPDNLPEPPPEPPPATAARTSAKRQSAKRPATKRQRGPRKA